MIAKQELTGRIFNIQKYSIYDGDGIRTLVFFKGCNIRCPWCANPEGLNSQFQVMFSHDKCINCGDCVSVCPAGIHYRAEENGEMKHFVDRNKDCIEAAANAKRFAPRTRWTLWARTSPSAS